MKYTDIKLGYNCNNNCVHCVIADQRERCKQSGRSDNRSTKEYISEMNDSRSRGFDTIVFTGGEPTIRKDILFLLDYAKKSGFNINMQTNGRSFYYKDYAQKFVPFDIFYAIALHGSTAEIHESITRVKGSFNQTVTGIKNLVKLGATNIYGKTVISSFNYRYLPEIADTFLRLGTRGMNFAFPHANGNAWKYFDTVVPCYSTIMPYVYKAIQHVQEYNLKNKTNKQIDFEAIPFCLMVGYENYVSEMRFLDNAERELKQLDSGTQDWNITRKQIKSKFPQCKQCKYDSICEGVWREYPEKRGNSEFRAILDTDSSKNRQTTKSSRKKPKITLLWSLYPLQNPNKIINPNLSIAHLSKFLEMNGFETTCIDCTLMVYYKWRYKDINSENKDEILHKLIQETEKTNPEILAVGSWTEGISFIKEFTKAFKKRNPNVKIILGGSLATSLPEKVLDFIPEVDYVVRGEGELTLLELVEKQFKGEKIEKILGISYKRKNGKKISNPERPFIKDLDTLPLIDFENFVYIEKQDIPAIVTSRGCPFSCKYCASCIFGHQYRYQSSGFILKQIKHLIDLYGVRDVSITDDNVLCNEQRTKKLFADIAKEKLDCRIPTAGRVDNLNKEILSILHKAKVSWLTVGIESIVPKALEYYKRTESPKDYISKAYKIGALLKNFNIGAAFSFVLGSPVEKERDMQKNLDLIRQLSKQDYLIYASQLRLIPGSHFWNDYLNKRVKVFKIKNQESRYVFDKPYDNLEWVCPSNFAFQSNHYSNQAYTEIMNTIFNEVDDLKNFE